MLAESLPPSLAGAVAGALLARCFSRGLAAYLNTQDNPVSLDFKLDWRLFAFLLAVSLVTCRAVRACTGAAGVAHCPACRDEGRRTWHDGRPRPAWGFRGGLVVSQVALSLVLLFSALLFTVSLRNLLTDDPGSRQKGVLTAGLDFTRRQIPAEKRGAFQAQLLERIASCSRGGFRS